MPVSRRILLGVGAALVVAGGGYEAWKRLAYANSLPAPGAPVSNGGLPAGDPRMTDRAIGKPDAPVTVGEWFSLTCPHCAAFHKQTMPQVHTDLVDTGKLRMIFHDFPLDQLALTASMIARSLPAERYEPFCAALLASQDRWAFARNVNSIDELAKMAALAGMSRDAFNAAAADDKLKAAILQVQDEGAKIYQVNSTPSFIFNGPGAKNRREAGDRSFDDFAKLVAAAAG